MLSAANNGHHGGPHRSDDVVTRAARLLRPLSAASGGVPPDFPGIASGATWRASGNWLDSAHDAIEPGTDVTCEIVAVDHEPNGWACDSSTEGLRSLSLALRS